MKLHKDVKPNRHGELRFFESEKMCAGVKHVWFKIAIDDPKRAVPNRIVKQF
jgi:hypothetical protein